MKRMLAVFLLAVTLLLSACSPDISDVEDPTPATDPADLFPGARTDAPDTME